MRRVVVTGLGIVSSLGNNKAEVLDSLRNGRSGITFQQEYATEVRKQLLKEHKIDVPETLVEKELEHSKREKKEIEEEYKMDFILEAIGKKRTN